MMVVEPSVSNFGIPHGKFDRYKQVIGLRGGLAVKKFSK